MSLRLFGGLAICLTLPGCAVLQTISDGLSDFVDANDDGPRFVYAVAADDPIIRFASITPDDLALPLSGRAIGIEGAQIDRLRLSPDTNHGAAGYNLFGPDFDDFGIVIMNATSGRIEAFDTDNTLSLNDDLACAVPRFVSEALPPARDYIAAVYPDLGIDPADVTVIPGIRDTFVNTLTLSGFSASGEVVASYDLASSTRIVVASAGIEEEVTDDILPRLDGPLVYTRQSDGSWSIDACPDPVPTVVRPTPLRSITLGSNDEILLDGAPLDLVLGAGQIERRQVVAVDGAW